MAMTSEQAKRAGAKGGHGNRGRPQSTEHVQKRVESAMRNLAQTRRTCQQCGKEYTPTVNAQRYCSGQCWNAKQRQKPYRQKSRAYKRSAFISPAEYRALLAAQGGVCAICGGVNPSGHKLACDHDHETGKVRGLLCHPCNTMLGLAGDDPDRLYAARIYLLRQIVRAVEAS